jgi:glycosyltransferase involved in cell wall biosynthesis
VKHLVLIVGVYYPHPSPTGKCASQYAALLNDNYSIDIIYIQSGLEKFYGIKKEGYILFGLSNWRLWIETWFQDQSTRTNNNLIRKLFLFCVKALKAVGKIQSYFLFPNNLRWYYKKAYKTLCKIHNENPIDVIFTVNSPFSAHLAGGAFKAKFPNIKWVTYTVDPFYAGYKYNKRKLSALKFNKAITKEKQILAQADVNFLSEEVFENSKTLYTDFSNKTQPLPYVLELNKIENYNFFDKNKINLVFAGRFYKDIRNPENFFKTFLLTKNPNLILHLYASSDCEELVEKYVKKSLGRIIRHPLVSTVEIQSIIKSADILVSVGNSIPDFKPSKIFEYIATGRPIINFYQQDILDEVLEKYPLSKQLSYKNNEIIQNAKELETFCINNKQKLIQSYEIEELYKKHSQSQIKKLLLDNI